MESGRHPHHDPTRPATRPDWTARLLTIHKPERAPALLSALFFFLLLYGYFLLRPLREAMGVQRSMNDLRALFITTCAVSLLVTLAFASIVARTERRTFIAIGYRAVIACLALFILALLALPDAMKLYSGYVFYVWLSVVNLFMVSVFWAFMNDVWTLEQSKRLFAAIGVGGTLGALLGSSTAWTLAEHHGPIPQILAAAVCFELAVQTMRRIDTRDQSTNTTAPSLPIGGSWIHGAKALATSPYMLGIGLWVVFMAVSSTLLYFTQARLVTDASDELNTRIALFAQLDMWTQLATLLVQLVVTSRLIKHLGIGLTLCVLPIVTIAGFAVLALAADSPSIEPWQLFAIFAAFNAVHRGTRYAVARPARETLVAVGTREEKYKPKPIVDVFLYRAGDVAGTSIDAALAAIAAGLWGIAFAAAPLAALWGALSIALALTQSRRARDQHPEAHHTTTTLTPALSTGATP